MTEGLKWTVNHVAKSDDKHLELMSEDNVKKANEFHKSFPQYTVTPLQDLAELASYLGVKSIHCKDESYRFGLNAFKVLVVPTQWDVTSPKKLVKTSASFHMLSSLPKN